MNKEVRLCKILQSFIRCPAPTKHEQRILDIEATSALLSLPTIQFDLSNYIPHLILSSSPESRTTSVLLLTLLCVLGRCTAT